jgi:hypothetical protein
MRSATTAVPGPPACSRKRPCRKGNAGQAIPRIEWRRGRRRCGPTAGRAADVVIQALLRQQAEQTTESWLDYIEMQSAPTLRAVGFVEAPEGPWVTA